MGVLFLFQKVNYAGIGGSSEFEQYKKLVLELIRVDVTSITRDEKLAFFINIYNALVIHANIERGPPTNLWQRYKVRKTLCLILLIPFCWDRVSVAVPVMYPTILNLWLWVTHGGSCSQPTAN